MSGSCNVHRLCSEVDVIVVDLPLTLELSDWETMRDWMQEHGITWYACGRRRLGFGNDLDATIFKLRWL